MIPRGEKCKKLSRIIDIEPNSKKEEVKKWLYQESTGN